MSGIAGHHTPRFGYEDPRAGRAHEERTYNSSGQMIRRTLVDSAVTATTLPFPYNFTAAGRDPRAVKKVQILLDTGGNTQVVITETGYDADLNEIETKAKPSMTSATRRGTFTFAREPNKTRPPGWTITLTSTGWGASNESRILIRPRT